MKAWDSLTNDIQIMVIGWEACEGLSSLYTRSWGPRRPKKFEWMKILRDILHGTKWIVFHGLLNNVLDLMKHITKGCGNQLDSGIGSYKYYIVKMSSRTTCYFALSINDILVHEHGPLHCLLSLRAH